MKNCVRTGLQLLPCLVCVSPVVRGPGPAPGARHHGAGEAGERLGHLSPGRHEVSAGLLPGQDCR